MNRKLIFIFVIASSFFLAGCEKEPDDFSMSKLKKSWSHLHEEEAGDGINIYRPSKTWQFQPSWYRQVFEFNDGFICDYLVLAPNDAHYMTTGTWEYNAESKVLTIFSADQIPLYEFEILELTNILLKLRPLY